MHIDAQTIINIKYVAAGLVLLAIIMAPAYLAAKNGKGKIEAMRIRVASWVFGWTGIGWLLALIWAVKK